MPAAEDIGIAEGFESAWAASFLHNNAPIWAALGADRFGVVALPSTVKRLTIYADYDPPGLSAALAFYEQHPELDVWIARPTASGSDFARLWEIDPLNPNRIAVTA